MSRRKIELSIGLAAFLVVVLLGSSLTVKSAVMEVAGLAVAQSQTLWKNLRDATTGDNLVGGIMASGTMGYNGAGFDRIRGTSADGLEVDVTRVQGTVTVVGNVTPSDTFANPTNAVPAWTLEGIYDGTQWTRLRTVGGDDRGTAGLLGNGPSLFDGAAWDRWRSVSNINNTASTSTGAAYVTPLTTWTSTHSPAASAQASTSKAAGGGTVRHVATGVIGCLFGQATVTGPAAGIMQLRDGASGAGTVLATWYFSIEATDETRHIPCVTMTGLNITGSANTALTLEFTAGITNAAETVTLMGYSTP